MAAGLSGVPVFNEGLLSRSVELSALGGPERGRARLAELFGAADLDRHPPPRRPEAAVLVGARRDGYVRADQIEALAARWRGSELVWLDTGHAGALVRHGAALRAAALRALDRLAS
jgi:predicted alpha/beta hydrolase family esterase